MSELTIGHLARESSVKPDTIRYYETFKLIEPVGRTSAGYRLYEDSSINRIIFIRRSKSFGFKLSEITTLLELLASQTFTNFDLWKRRFVMS